MRSRKLTRATAEVLEVRRLLATITVTTTADDVIPADGSVSLREAITAINAGFSGDPDVTLQNPGAFGSSDAIHFNIGSGGLQTINVGTDPSAPNLPLPIVSKMVTIDGTTQPGFDTSTHVPIIELNGTSAGNNSGSDGFQINADGTKVLALIINRFGADGILLYH